MLFILKGHLYFVFASSDLELEACINFIKDVINNFSEDVVTFHVDLLANKIAEVCLGPIEKVILTFGYFIHIKICILSCPQKHFYCVRLFGN